MTTTKFATQLEHEIGTADRQRAREELDWSLYKMMETAIERSERLPKAVARYFAARKSFTDIVAVNTSLGIFPPGPVMGG